MVEIVKLYQADDAHHPANEMVDDSWTGMVFRRDGRCIHHDGRRNPVSEAFVWRQCDFCEVHERVHPEEPPTL